jgi:hypothetical protein
MGWSPCHGLESLSWVGVPVMGWSPCHGLESLSWVGVPVMSNQKLKLVFAASLLITQHYGERAKTGHLRIRIGKGAFSLHMCQSSL